MKYNCGTEVMLGDEIMVSHGGGQQTLARVVAIGRDIAADSIDPLFYSWAKSEDLINEKSVVVQWVGENPFSHDDPNYAPVGDYVTLDSITSETFVQRGG